MPSALLPPEFLDLPSEWTDDAAVGGLERQLRWHLGQVADRWDPVLVAEPDAVDAWVRAAALALVAGLQPSGPGTSTEHRVLRRAALPWARDVLERFFPQCLPEQGGQPRWWQTHLGRACAWALAHDPDEEDVALTQSEAAQLLGVARSTVLMMSARGELEGRRLGGGGARGVTLRSVRRHLGAGLVQRIWPYYHVGYDALTQPHLQPREVPETPVDLTERVLGLSNPDEVYGLLDAAQRRGVLPAPVEMRDGEPRVVRPPAESEPAGAHPDPGQAGDTAVGGGEDRSDKATGSGSAARKGARPGSPREQDGNPEVPSRRHRPG